MGTRTSLVQKSVQGGSETFEIARAATQKLRGGTTSIKSRDHTARPASECPSAHAHSAGDAAAMHPPSGFRVVDQRRVGERSDGRGRAQRELEINARTGPDRFAEVTSGEAVGAI